MGDLHDHRENAATSSLPGIGIVLAIAGAVIVTTLVLLRLAV